jgi:hypothetical protein
LHILAKLAPSKSLAADLAFQIVFLFCVNYSCGLVLTVETDRINFSSRFVAFDFLGRALIGTAISWTVSNSLLVGSPSEEFGLRRRWQALKVADGYCLAWKRTNRTNGILSTIAWRYSPGEFAALFGKHQSWGYRQLYRGTVRAITQCGRTMIPRGEIDRLLCSAKPYNGKIQPARLIQR